MTGAIAALAAYGSSAISVQLHNRTISVSGVRPQTAGYSIANDGNAKDGTGLVLEAWLIGGSVANYDVRVTPQSGATLTGTTGSWLNCATTRSWSITNNGTNNSTLSSQFLVEIRLTSSGVVQASATITLSATNSGGGGGGGVTMTL